MTYLEFLKTVSVLKMLYGSTVARSFFFVNFSRFKVTDAIDIETILRYTSSNESVENNKKD